MRTAETYIRRNINVCDDGCWEWIKSLGFWGYGTAYYNGQKMGAHRFSYQTFKGEIPDGLMVCHHCDNRACANPAHLYIASQNRNMADCAIRYRAGGQKLRREDYAEIKWLFALDMSPTTISEMFNITPNYVGLIGSGKAKALQCQ